MARHKKIKAKTIMLVVFLTLFLANCLSLKAFAQSDRCTKPKVAVRPSQMNDAVIDHLNKQYQSQPNAVWQQQIQMLVLEELRKSSPGTQFIPGGGDECDYYFSYIPGSGLKREI